MTSSLVPTTTLHMRHRWCVTGEERDSDFKRVFPNHPSPKCQGPNSAWGDGPEPPNRPASALPPTTHLTFHPSRLSFPSIFFCSRETNSFTPIILSGADPQMLHFRPQGKMTLQMNLKLLLFIFLLFSLSRVTPIRDVLNICEAILLAEALKTVPLDPAGTAPGRCGCRRAQGRPRRARTCFPTPR